MASTLPTGLDNHGPFKLQKQQSSLSMVHFSGAYQLSPAVPSAPYGKVRHEISSVDLSTATAEDNDLRISECKTVASYNWVTKPDASIVVPGMPAKWTPLLTPRQLSEDCGTFYRD
ncbi:hypothetical protein E4U31_007750, partial [Claviceps sp. LM219 group G6]